MRLAKSVLMLSLVLLTLGSVGSDVLMRSVVS